jgi:hypothetical protein
MTAPQTTEPKKSTSFKTPEAGGAGEGLRICGCRLNWHRHSWLAGQGGNVINLP